MYNILAEPITSSSWKEMHILGIAREGAGYLERGAKVQVAIQISYNDINKPGKLTYDEFTDYICFLHKLPQINNYNAKSHISAIKKETNIVS